MGTLIAAFDIATHTGVCFGPVGGKPKLMTWDLYKGGTSRPWRLYYLAQCLERFFSENSIDVLRYEAAMSIAVANRVGSSEATQMLLRGAIGVVECEAARARIPDIGSFTVHAARKHLGAVGKPEVMRICRMLRVKVANDNEADAFAGWSYACGLANPRLAHLVTPLFAGAGVANR
jgi:hypothetical protein